MRHFICPHCGKHLDNQNTWVENENANEFWCDTCGKVYIVVDDHGNYIEEEG